MLVRPVARLEQLSYYEGLSKRVAELHSSGITAKAIAKKTNEEGWRPARRRDTFNSYMVSNILSRMGLTKIIKTESSKKKTCNEWTLPELTRKLDISPITLYSWYQKDRLTAHNTKVDARIRLMIKADETEIERLRSIRNLWSVNWVGQLGLQLFIRYKEAQLFGIFAAHSGGCRCQP